ncbi:hypothetical protein MMC27_005147 [Xylographa pallens]|nr:hypothetical protein [Xylographa pallens]
MKLTKSKPLGENKASNTEAHGKKVLRTGRLRRLAKFVKGTTRYFHKPTIKHDKCESEEIGAIEQSQFENSLVATTDTTELDTDHQKCQCSIDYPPSQDTPTQSSTTAASYGYINTSSTNTVAECFVTPADIYENEVLLQAEIQSHNQPVHSQALYDESSVAIHVFTKLPSPSVPEYAAPYTFDVMSDHAHQVSASSTLPVSLRNHVSEPSLQDRYIEPPQPCMDSSPLELRLQEFKEIQAENNWNCLLDSQKTQHDNEIAELCDNLEDEVKYLKADLEKANKRKDYLEARIKKEVLQKLTSKEDLKALQEQHQADRSRFEAQVRELTERNLEMVTIVSGMVGNEANYKEKLFAKANEVNQIRDHLREVLVRAKEETDHSTIKIQRLHYALDGTPMADDFDIKGHLELKKQQVQKLSNQVIELSKELERVESEAACHQIKANREVENSRQETKRSQDVEFHLRSLLEIAESNKNQYLVLLGSDPAVPEDARLQAANKVLATVGKEMSLLITEKAKLEWARADAEDGRLALEFLHRDLRVEFEKKVKEIEDLQHKNEALTGEKGHLDAELSIIIDEKHQGIRGRDQAIKSYQDVIEALQQHIGNLGGLEADVRTASVWNAKLAEVNHLKESLKQAQLVILEHEQRRHERQEIEALDACLASSYDQVTYQQAEQLNLATEECARLRVVIQELVEAEEAHDYAAPALEPEAAQQPQGSDSNFCNRVCFNEDSFLEEPPAADQGTGKYGSDDWGKLEVFFRAVADNLGTDSALLNLVADYQTEIQRLRCLADVQPAKEVQNDHKIIRRVRGNENLFAIYQKTAAKGKGKAEEFPVCFSTVSMGCLTT